ncbi:MAG TPA: GNAT family protein [Acetivibrio sp.]|uniref:GNAT family N-acetyltransferase n=1 Tax=Acetivibrio sp. TaxID=1872092 RepID=UPI002CF88456|nr:GNAT family protein [Acetivibrio sp.]HOM01681.1 GNAT family protein [Acetivibrio sp.]
MDTLKITTERLIISEFDESMAEIVHLNSLDDDNRKFVPDEVFETVEEAQKILKFLIECYKGMNGPLVYPVLLKSGENIGYVQAVPTGDEWEIGYHIASHYTCKGYAT